MTTDSFLTEQDIVRIAPHITRELYHFAVGYLNLSEIAFTNSSGIIHVSTAEVAQRCLEHWRRSRTPPYTARDLRDILVKARYNGLNFSQDRIDSLNNSTELTNRDLTRISKGFTPVTWNRFVNCHFNFDVTPTLSMLPIEPHYDPTRSAYKVLRTWINTSPAKKRSDLKNVLDLAVQDGLFDRWILEKFEDIIE